MGTKVGQVAAALGEPFMPWQQYVADVAYEIDPATGLLVYGEVGLTVPRQQGKTTLTKAVATHRAVGMATPEWGGPQLIRYAAQTRNDAREKMVEEVWPALEASPFASLFTKRLQNGAEHLTYSVADGGKIKEYKIDKVGREILEIPLGRFATTKLQRIMDGKTTIWWCAEQLHFLPVKIQQNNEQGRLVVALLHKLEGIVLPEMPTATQPR